MSNVPVGAIALDLNLNQKAFQNQLNGMAKQTKSMVSSAFSGIGKLALAAFSLGSITRFVRGAMNIASDLIEVQNVVDVTFGNSAEKVNEWAKSSIDAFGMSELSAKQYASTMGAILKSSRVKGDIAEMSTNIVALSGDMASFYNMDYGVAFSKIRSGLMGMVLPMRSIGVDISKVAIEEYALSKGITKSYKEMSQSEKVMIRYGLITDRLADSEGDFARTRESYANQTRVLREQTKAFMADMGQGFINVFIHVVRWLNVAILKMQDFAKSFSKVTELFFGKAILGSKGFKKVGDDAEGTAESVEDIGDAATKTGKAVKGALAGFDQLNTLSFGGAGGSSSDEPPLAEPEDTKNYSKIEEAVDSLQNKLKGFADYMEAHFTVPLVIMWTRINEEIKIAKKNFDGFVEDVKKVFKNLAGSFDKYVTPMLQVNLPRIGTIFANLLHQINVVFKGIWDAVFPVIEWLSIDGVAMFASFTDSFIKLAETVSKEATKLFDLLWKDTLEPLVKWFSTVAVDSLTVLKKWWDEDGKPTFDSMNEIITGMGEDFDHVWKTYIKPVINVITREVEKLKAPIIEIFNQALKVVTNIAELATTMYNTFIRPTVNWFNDLIGPAISDFFRMMVGGAGEIILFVVDMSVRFIAAFNAVLTFLNTGFTTGWKSAWTGLKNSFEQIFSGIGDAFKRDINSVISFVNNMIEVVNKARIFSKDNQIAKIPLMAVSSYIPPEIRKLMDSGIIPRSAYATGGIISKPTLAMMGESGKKEAVVPLENTSFAQEIARALSEAVIKAMNNGGNQNSSQRNSGDVILKIGESEFGRVSINAINALQRQTGRTLLVV